MHITSRFCGLVLAALLLAHLCGGCVGRPPAPEPSADAFQLAGASDAIQLTVNGQPVDQPDGEPTELSLTIATQRALAASPEIQAALARTRAAWADARQQRLLPNPILNVAVRFPTDDGDTIIEAGLSQDVLSLLTMPRRASRADHRLRASIAEVLVTVLDLLAEVQETYIAVRASQAELAALSDRANVANRLGEIARSRVEAGESSQLDVISIQADRAALELEIAEKSAEQRQQRLALARLIGQPSGRADWSLSEWSADSAADIDEGALIIAALHRRPEIQSRMWDLAALGDDLKLAQVPFDTIDAGIDAEHEDDWTIGPAVSTPLPVFDLGQARRDKANAQVIEARHLLTLTQRIVVREVRQAYAALRAAQATLTRVQNELIPLQERRRAQAEAAYRNGFADITTLLLAEQQAQETRSTVIKLQRKAASSRVQLERAVGGSGVVARLPATAPTER